MRETEIIVGLIQQALLSEAGDRFGQLADPTTEGRHVLADTQIEPFHESGVDLPAMPGQLSFDPRQRAKDHSSANLNQSTAAAFFDDLGIVQGWQRHPSGFEPPALAMLRLNPMTKVG